MKKPQNALNQQFSQINKILKRIFIQVKCLKDKKMIKRLLHLISNAFLSTLIISLPQWLSLLCLEIKKIIKKLQNTLDMQQKQIQQISQHDLAQERHYKILVTIKMQPQNALNLYCLKNLIIIKPSAKWQLPIQIEIITRNALNIFTNA